MEKWLGDEVEIAKTYDNIGIVCYEQSNAKVALNNFLRTATVY